MTLPDKDTVVIGMLGTTLDKGGGTEKRWNRWRPSVALFQHEDVLISRFECLYPPREKSLARQVKADIKQVSPETTVNLIPLEVNNPWDFEEVYGHLSSFADTFAFSPETEDYLVHITTGTHVAQICWFLLTESRHIPGQLLQASPGRRGDTVGTFSVIDLDLSRYDALARRFEKETDDALAVLKSGIATQNKAFNQQIEEIEHVALRSREPMLIMGPTGAGKSHLASRVYALKKARHQLKGPFVEVNCATLRGDGAMSTLFGHKRGAFTGATTDRQGLLRQADGGLLFLDEIGELGLDEQAMLLRALEHKTFFPMGGDKEVQSDFQLIAGTNRDLRERTHGGQFREDLLARINLWTFTLPGLKDRIEDVAPNLEFELAKYAQRYNQRVTFNREAKARYLKFATSGGASWAGNFRDLNASVTRMATLAPKGRIDVGTVQGEVTRLNASWKKPATKSDVNIEALLGEDAHEQFDPFDLHQLTYVADVCRSARSLSDAGRTLFAVSRTQKKSSNDADRLRKYLARFGLSYTDVIA